MLDAMPDSARRSITALRVTTAALAVLAVVEAALAGRFLSGHYDALMLHRITAMAMAAVAVGQAVIALVARRAGASRQVFLTAVLLPVPIAAEAVLGAFRVLGLHVPIGALLIAGILRLAALVWRAPALEPAVSA
jgi:hypothetical protein